MTFLKDLSCEFYIEVVLKKIQMWFHGQLFAAAFNFAGNCLGLPFGEGNRSAEEKKKFHWNRSNLTTKTVLDLAKTTSSSLRAASTLVNCGCQCSRFATWLFGFFSLLNLSPNTFCNCGCQCSRFPSSLNFLGCHNFDAAWLWETKRGTR